MAKFIAASPIASPGVTTEQWVWRRVELAFNQRDCLVYWRYPIFSQMGKRRQEADILIADKDLGVFIIEVKAITIDQIISIQGHLWQYQNYYQTQGNPYQQAEAQLFALLDYIGNEPCLAQKIPGRVAVALPLIKAQEWQRRGLAQLPSNPPIIFQEQIQKSHTFLPHLQSIPLVVKGKPLSSSDWQLLIATLSGSHLLNHPPHRVLSPPQSRGQILAQVRSHLSQLDVLQWKLAQQIPAGPQRIRGVAGSGKTVLLCQKAVLMHLKHPEWKIALVFFSRSLYHQMVSCVDGWLRHFSQNQRSYSPQSNLQILPAWGSKEQPGLYSYLCKKTKVQRLTVSDTIGQKPQESLGEACVALLQQTAIPPCFDVILIDEAQDLITENWHYQQKQPFFWLAYQALRSVSPLHPEQRRLIWAYDELQSLYSRKIPHASELLGEDLGHLVTGYYADGVPKTVILSRCYRTPGPLFIFAQALGMGLSRPEGMLTGMTTKAEWEAMGYQVTGELTPGNPVTLSLVNSCHPLPQWWSKPLIEFHTYTTRQREVIALAKNIFSNLRDEGLRPSREILVIVLGDFFTASRLETYVAQFLQKQGIDIYLPGAVDCNSLEADNQGKFTSRFWYEGAVTVTRIHRAKGHEADLVYLVGLDNLAQEEQNLSLRNQLFVAITRSKGWLHISGIGCYPLYQEIQGLISVRNSLTFTFYPPKKWEVSITETQELLRRYTWGERYFQNSDLRQANLAGISLRKANLIGANLSKANLRYAQLQEANLSLADLRGADLTGANLQQAKLMGAKLNQAKISETNFQGADLTNVEWEEEE